MTIYIVSSYSDLVVISDNMPNAIVEPNIQDYYINPLVVNNYIVEEDVDQK